MVVAVVVVAVVAVAVEVVAAEDLASSEHFHTHTRRNGGWAEVAAVLLVFVIYSPSSDWRGMRLCRRP